MKGELQPLDYEIANSLGLEFNGFGQYNEELHRIQRFRESFEFSLERELKKAEREIRIAERDRMIGVAREVSRNTVMDMLEQNSPIGDDGIYFVSTNAKLRDGYVQINVEVLAYGGRGVYDRKLDRQNGGGLVSALKSLSTIGLDSIDGVSLEMTHGPNFRVLEQQAMSPSGRSLPSTYFVEATFMTKIPFGTLPEIDYKHGPNGTNVAQR